MLTLGSFDVKSEAFVAFATSGGPLILEANHLASLEAAHAKFVKSTYDQPVEAEAFGGDGKYCSGSTSLFAVLNSSSLLSEVPPSLFRLLVALRVASLMDAKSCVRPDILKSLAELANMPTSHSVCLGMSDAQACRALLCSLKIDLFSQDELCVLTSGSPFTGAQALLSLHHIRQLEALQVAAVSLSMLALDAPGSALQEDPAEQFSPLKQAIGRVKFIVEGSKTTKTDIATWAHHLQSVACMVPLVESLERASLAVYKKQCLKPDKRNPHPIPASRLLGTTMASVKVALHGCMDCTAERCARLLDRCARATEREAPTNPLPEAPITLNPCKDVDTDFLTTCDDNHLLPTVVRLLEMTLGEIRTARVVLADQDAAAYCAACEKVARGKKNVSPVAPLGAPARKLLTTLEDLSNLDTYQVEMAVTPLNLTGRLPKIPKGTQDFGPARMNLRGSVLDAVRSVFQKYGAVEIDTPVFELTDTLLGKYGEDQKLIFSLKDQGGEQLALRYDLTVPFARYCAVNKVENIKRFHIGKVYRRDEPQMAKGRYREFYQCDFDIAGKHDSMVADAEVLSVFHELLTTFRPQIGPFEVKLNHRKLLDGMLEVCGVPLHSVRGISSAIDKLDKETWDVVREEMVDKKNLDPQVADRLRPYCCMRGRLGEMLATIEGDELLMGSASVRLAVVDLQALNPLIDDTDFVLDLSLARGLDYYTGLIYEAILVDGGVGSIGAGGRYDKLIGMFSSTDIPAIGVSLGLERIFRILEATFSVSPYEKVTTATTPIRQTQTDVFVCSIGEDLLPHRMRIAQELRNGGIGTEFAFSSKAKLVKQLAKAQTDKVPLVVVVGQDEIDNGTIKLRKMYYGKESNNRDDVVVNRADLVTAVQAVLDEEGSSRTRLQKLVLGIDSV